MKKFFAAGTTLAAAALLLSGCGGGDATTGSSDSPSADPSAETTSTAGQLTIWVDETRQTALQDAAAKFEQDNGVTVNLELHNFDDIRNDFATQVQNGAGPDITVGANDWLGEFVEKAVIAPVDLSSVASELDSRAVKAYESDGQTYGVPYALENIALFRNNALDSDTSAQTFDDLIAEGKEAGTQYSVLVQMGENGDGYHMYPIQSSFGAHVFEQDANGDFTCQLAMGGDAGHNFANYLKKIADEGVTGPSITQDIVTDAFKNGEVPYIITGPWNSPDFTAAGLDYSVLAIPSAGGQPSQALMGVPGFYLSANSQNGLMANEFLLNYITDKDVQLELFQAGGRPPANLAAQQDPSVMNDPVASGFALQAENSIVQPSIPAMNSVWGPWGTTEKNISDGTAADPAAAWDQMITDITNAIGTC
ncbi:MAG: extracellular solute-binding protein [Propionibacteriaceae bacterium]|jgi:arabinogalactan oligomer/maltooligosaccharide transport system substrate-binding protein|nr:extracellular solute-binding protein [Propionibacteriaceae bacterium]